MTNICSSRIQREIREIVSSIDLGEQGVLVEVIDNNIQHLRGYLRGPPNSPYAGSTFMLDIQIPDDYPFKPPKVKFTTRVWHPNVSSVTGTICLDVLKDNWAASMTLRTILLSIQALLTLPEPKDPQDAVVASQYMNKPELFEKTATFWAQYFAGSSDEKRNGAFSDKLKKLRDMGVEEEIAVTALSNNDWDLDKTISAVF